MVVTALISEVLALYFGVTFKNNLPIYNVYSVVELIILSQYFNSLKILPVKINIYILAPLVIILEAVNIIYFQPINSLSSNFILLEGFCVIAMSLYAFYKMLLDNDTLNILKYNHFWLVSLLLFYWSLTYMTWGLYEVIAKEIKEYLWLPFKLLLVANIITYAGIGIIFLFAKKHKPAHG